MLRAYGKIRLNIHDTSHGRFCRGSTTGTRSTLADDAIRESCTPLPLRNASRRRESDVGSLRLAVWFEYGGEAHIAAFWGQKVLFSHPRAVTISRRDRCLRRVNQDQSRAEEHHHSFGNASKIFGPMNCGIIPSINSR